MEWAGRIQVPEQEPTGPDRDSVATPYLVGATADRAEADADRLADLAVARLATPEATDLGGVVRRAPTVPFVGDSGGPAPAEVGRAIDDRRGNGRPLDSSEQRRFSDALGRSVAGARIHTDQTAGWLNQQLGAEAFTVGQDVYFSPGSFRPGSPEGDHLIAHELAHTLEPRPTVQRRPVGPAGQPVIRRHGGIGPKLTGAIPKSKEAWSRVEIGEEQRRKGMPTSGASAQADAVRWFRDKLVRYVVVGLGAEGAGVTSSEQRQQMRAQLKLWGLEQVDAEIRTALATIDADRKRDGERALLPTEKEWAGFAAKQKAASKVKKSLAGSVETVAEKIVDEAIAEIDLSKGDLDQDDFLKALRSAKGKVRQRKQDVVGKADASKRDDAQASADEGELQQGVASGAVGIGGKAVKDVIKADSVEGGMGKLGQLLDAVVPNSGDTCQVSVALMVPVWVDGVSSVSLEVALTGAAARGIDGAMTAGVPVFGDPRRLEVRGDLAVKLVMKGEVPQVLSVESKVGVTVFARAGADTTALALKALSYGGYRRLSAVSDDLANVWATGHLQRSDQTSKERMHEAEAWAAMVEAQAFKEGNAYSDVGATLSSEIKFTAGGKGTGMPGFKISGAVGVSTFQRYDKAALERSMNRASELEERLTAAIDVERDDELDRIRRDVKTRKKKIDSYAKRAVKLHDAVEAKIEKRDGLLEHRELLESQLELDRMNATATKRKKTLRTEKTLETVEEQLEELDHEIADMLSDRNDLVAEQMKEGAAVEALERELEDVGSSWSDVQDDVDAKSDLFAQPVGTPERAKRRRRHAHGEWGQSWSASLGATVSLPAATLNLGFSASGNFSAWGVELTAGFDYAPGSDLVFEQIVAGMLPALTNFLTTCAGALTKSSKAAKAGNVGSTLSTVPQMMNAQLGNQIQTGMAELSSKGAVISDHDMLKKAMDAGDHTPMFSAKSTAEVAILIGMDGGKLTLRLEIRSGKKIEFTFEQASSLGVGVQASYESKQRVFAAGLDPSRGDGSKSRWNVEAGGNRARKSNGKEALGLKGAKR